MGLLVDAVIVVIFAVSLFLGWKRGFFRSVIRLATVGLAIAGAYFLYGAFGTFLKEKLFMSRITSYILRSLESASAGLGIDELFSKMPVPFVEKLNVFSTAEKAQEWYGSAQNATLGKLSEKLADPIASTVSSIVAFILLFAAFLLVLKLVTFVIDRVLRLPVLNGLNKLLGLLLGALIGLGLAWVAAVALEAGLPKLGMFYPVFKDAAKDSLLLTALCGFNPLGLIGLFDK